MVLGLANHSLRTPSRRWRRTPGDSKAGGSAGAGPGWLWGSSWLWAPHPSAHRLTQGSLGKSSLSRSPGFPRIGSRDFPTSERKENPDA